jgi:hypothetical protein
MPLDEVGRDDRSAAQLRVSVRRQPSWRRPSRRIGCRPSPSNLCWSRQFEHRPGAGVGPRAPPSGLESRPCPIPEADRALTREAAVHVLKQPHRSRTGLVCRAMARVWLAGPGAPCSRSMSSTAHPRRARSRCRGKYPRSFKERTGCSGVRDLPTVEAPWDESSSPEAGDNRHVILYFVVDATYTE